MTAVASRSRARAPGRPAPAAAVVVTLALAEARRLLLSPVVLGALALTVLGAAQVPLTGDREVYGALTGLVAWVLGPASVVAGFLLGSRERRHDAGEWAGVTPTGLRCRTAAQLLAVLALVGLAVVVSALLWVWFLHLSGAELYLRPPLLEVASGPLCVLGGGWLGVMVARWWPWTPAVGIVLVLLVALNVLATARPGTVLLGFYVDFPLWPLGAPDVWAGLVEGDRGWHATYLLALSGSAAVGALVATPGRRVVLVGVGALLVGTAVVAGVLQLP